MQAWQVLPTTPSTAEPGITSHITQLYCIYLCGGLLIGGLRTKATKNKLLLHLLHEKFLSPNLHNPLTAPSVHLLRRVVEEHSENDHGGAEAGEEGDLVAEEDDGGPDEEGALAGVGHAVRDGADEVHEVVGGDGLTVEEESVEEQVEEHGQVGAQYLETLKKNQ
jgi:hypothetical protein